jgi:hypothetical protein
MRQEASIQPALLRPWSACLTSYVDHSNACDLAMLKTVPATHLTGMRGLREAPFEASWRVFEIVASKQCLHANIHFGRHGKIERCGTQRCV